MMRTIPLAFVALFACGSSSNGPPANVAGTYTVSVTNGQNGCMVGTFTPGAMTAGVTVQVTQNGTQVSADVMGLAGVYLTAGVGSSTLVGQINGSTANLTASANHTTGMCAYTTTATANMTFDGDTMQGTITYSDSGNGSSDCGVVEACTNTQNFAGSRPPPSG
ncbi:MAG TPA: hypothetical protein VMI75_27675 [Polyangiaceae bacterium]|nr:hypothetical protein [Polyangiaceae bacterium]